MTHHTLKKKNNSFIVWLKSRSIWETSCYLTRHFCSTSNSACSNNSNKNGYSLLTCIQRLGKFLQTNPLLIVFCFFLAKQIKIKQDKSSGIKAFLSVWHVVLVPQMKSNSTFVLYFTFLQPPPHPPQPQCDYFSIWHWISSIETWI